METKREQLIYSALYCRLLTVVDGAELMEQQNHLALGLIGLLLLSEPGAAL